MPIIPHEFLIWTVNDAKTDSSNAKNGWQRLKKRKWQYMYFSNSKLWNCKRRNKPFFKKKKSNDQVICLSNLIQNYMKLIYSQCSALKFCFYRWIYWLTFHAWMLMYYEVQFFRLPFFHWMFCKTSGVMIDCIICIILFSYFLGKGKSLRPL